MEQLESQWTDVYEIWYLAYFSKICPENLSFIKMWQKPVLYSKTNIHISSYSAQFFLEWEILQTEFVKDIKTPILCSVTFVLENRTLCETMWTNRIQTGRPQMTMVHVHCMLDNYAINTPSEYAILINFSLQQWLHEGISMLCKTYCASIA